MKKFLLLFLTCVMAFTSFSGCEQAKTPVVDTHDITETGTPTPNRCAETLFIWWSQENEDLTLLNDAWYDFKDLYAAGDNSKYPEKVSMFSMEGNADGKTQLEQQIMAGTAPDIVRMDHVYVTALGQAGQVFDLQKEFGASDTIKDLFIESTWNASSFFDAVYGIPFDANTYVFGAKTSVLEQADVAIPTTYEELRTSGARIKALNLSENVYTLPGGTDTRYSWPPLLFLSWLWRLGGDLLNEEMTEAIFNDPETGVAALNMMIQLQADGLISKTEYEEGKTSLCDYGTWWLNGFNAEETMTFALQPQLKEGVPQYSALGVYDLAIVTDAKKPQMAYDFAVHLATGKASASGEYYSYTFVRNHSFLPALKVAAETGYTWSSDTASEFWRVSVQQLAVSKSRPSVPCWPEIEEALVTAITQAFQGEKTPQEALDDAAAAADWLLDEWHNGKTE